MSATDAKLSGVPHRKSEPLPPAGARELTKARESVDAAQARHDAARAHRDALVAYWYGEGVALRKIGEYAGLSPQQVLNIAKAADDE